MNGAFRSLLVPFTGRPIAALGLVALVCITAAAIMAPIIAPYDPSKIEPVFRLLPPDAAHWFGTDQFGRDILSRVIYGTRLALLIGIGVVTFALITGVPAGVLSALFPRFGSVVMRIIDVLMSFPALLLALGLIVILGRGVTNAILAIGVVYLTTTSRITYGLALRLRTEAYVEAANSMGAGVVWTIRKHILPNSGFPSARAGELCFRVCPTQRRLPRLSRAWRATGNSELGQHAGGSSHLHYARAVAFVLSRFVDRDHCLFS